MNKKHYWRTALLLAIVLASAFPRLPAAESGHPPTPSPSASGAIQVRDDGELTLLVTDSGLGGLSIMAQTAARMKKAGVAGKVQLVFCNALFSNDSGYNSLGTRADKARVFQSALQAMEHAVHPDVLIIGCNTLSVIYPDTDFAGTARIPVIRIIDPGIALFRKALEQNPDAALLLFGTETTISDGIHRTALQAAGIGEERIIAKACPELAAYIENDWRSEQAGLLIASYVDEALAQLSDRTKPVYAGLVCTHYGYALNLWENAFKENHIRLMGLLNPNDALVAALFNPEKERRYDSTQIEARVLSMVEIAASKRNSLGAWLKGISVEVAVALENYQHLPDLFEWKSLIKR